MNDEQYINGGGSFSELNFWNLPSVVTGIIKWSFIPKMIKTIIGRHYPPHWEEQILNDVKYYRHFKT